MAHIAERLRTLLQHRRIEGDTVNNAVLDAIVDSVGDALERLGVIAFGDPDADPVVPAGQALSDPSVAPVWALRHAALYMGATLPGRLTGESLADWEARAREYAVDPRGIRRGTHIAIERAVTPLLTGTQEVFIGDEHDGGYTIVVRTQDAETPDPVAVRKAVEGGAFVSGASPGVMGAEFVLAYVTSDDVTFAEATLTFNVIPNGITAENVTRDDVT